MSVQEYIEANSKRDYPFLTTGDYGAAGWDNSWFGDIGIYIKPGAQYDRDADGDIELQSIDTVGASIVTFNFGCSGNSNVSFSIVAVSSPSGPSTTRFDDPYVMGFVIIAKAETIPASVAAGTYTGAPNAVVDPSRIINASRNSVEKIYISNAYSIGVDSSGNTVYPSATYTDPTLISSSALNIGDGRFSQISGRNGTIVVQPTSDPAVGEGFSGSEAGCDDIVPRPATHDPTYFTNTCVGIINRINGVVPDGNGSIRLIAGAGIDIVQGSNTVTVKVDNDLLTGA